MSTTSENVPLHREETRSQFFLLVHITGVARTFGLITAAIMWVGAVFMWDKSKTGFTTYYLVTAAIIVSFFEITWVLNKCACCGQEGCCCRIWRVIMWVDNWKKFFLYLGLSVPLFLEGTREVWAIVTGFILVLLSTVYLVKTFYSNVSVRYERSETRQVTRQVVSHETSTQTEQP